MARIIEARVIQKVATEAEWLQTTLPLYQGEIAFVSDKNNFKMNTQPTPKLFSELEYYYKGDILGSVAIGEEASKESGVYRALTSGTIGGVVVKEGYYTLLRKLENGTWVLESEVEMPISDLTEIEKSIGLKSVIKNPNFDNGINDWVKNESAITLSVLNSILTMNTIGTSDPAIYQAIDLKKNTDLKIKIRARVISGDSTIKVGFTDDKKYVKLSHNFQEFEFNSKTSTEKTYIFIISPKPNTIIEVDYCYLYIKYTNSIDSNLDLISSKLNINNVNLLDYNLLNWLQNEPGGLTKYFDESELAYRFNSTIDNRGIAQHNVDLKTANYKFKIRVKKTTISDVNLKMGLFPNNLKNYTIKTNDWVIFEDILDFTFVDFKMFLIVFQKDTEVLIDYVNLHEIKNDSLDGKVYELESKINELEINTTNEWKPISNNSKSNIYDYIRPFVNKMQLRNQDVNLISIGDSIATDLNWTDKRSDANERPPFCTEYNINSYLEEKLRWKEQKYRRFDYNGVFTEILGGGTSLIKETDSNWAVVGGAYLYPITKVIDGGTNAGISFKMPEKIKRLSLIVHSDSQFASQTKVTISSGNGKVEVFDGVNWVEANNYVKSFKETEVIPTRTEIRDNAINKLMFRSLSDLTEKTITVQNIGDGRFGYWGIEYSPKEYMFSYICASKGSHGIDLLSIYQEWMVDAFKPDLVLQQCCILNQALGQENRAKSPQQFANDFKIYQEQFESKGYLVLPYILWAATYSYFIDANGNFLNGTDGSGKEFTCFDDTNYLTKMYEDKNIPAINLFQRITEVGLEKAKIEHSNLYTSALVGSGKNGNTFTIDGIHLNKLGNEVCWLLLEEYFNY